jgi:integrase
LRASELRGLRWANIDLNSGAVRVRQRADHRNIIGRLKTQTSERDIPVGPFVVNTLKEWKLACRKTALDLAFPAEDGGPLTHSVIMNSGYWPPQRAAGIVAAATCSRGATTAKSWPPPNGRC